MTCWSSDILFGREAAQSYHVLPDQHFTMSVPRLNPREREVLDAVHRLGRASAEEVRAAMAAPPTNAAVRATLRSLEAKGHLQHERDGRKYVYGSTEAPKAAGRKAIRHVVQTFFADAPEDAFAALLSASTSNLSAESLDRIGSLIDEARSQDASEQTEGDETKDDR